MNKKKILITFGLIYFLLNVLPLPLHRGPHFDCEPGNGGPYAQQFGIPFVYLQRSITFTACSFSSGDFYQGHDDSYYGVPHIYLDGFVADAALGILILIGLNEYLRRKSKTKGKRRG